MHGSSTCSLTCRSTRCRRICNRSMLIDTQGSRVSRRINSSHAASHLDVYVSPCSHPLQFQTSRTHKSHFKNVAREREIEKESGRFKSMVDSDDRYSTEKASSVQSTILYDCEAEALSKSIHPRQSDSSKVKWRYCPELVQFHGLRSVEVLLDTPPGIPKNCPEAKGGSVRIHISPSRPVSVFMIKPRLCPSRDQSSPVKTFILGFGHVLSDQPAASRLEHCELVLCEFHLEFRED
ncbi:hypothetical protein F2Q70_00012484 [Brassica cretica]|uniref:Uncharacterized protein n=1 Tax=Brassica cretica TaxID=69181 RepID=A0A8S9M608_BRACR|nr:hypothetical protein F2Q70_00012484 [Brassica cretica]